MEQKINYDLEKLIKFYNTQRLFNEAHSELITTEEIELQCEMLQKILEIKNYILERDFREANSAYFAFRDKYKNKLQNDLILSTISFYKDNSDVDYPTNYQDDEQPPVEPQHIELFNFDKLITEIEEVKALAPEFKNIQVEIKNLANLLIKEPAQTHQPESNSFDATLASEVKLLTLEINKLEPILTALNDPKSTYSELQSNMSKHITDMNNIVMKNVEEARDKFILSLSGDVAVIKKEMNSEAVKLISELSAINKQNHQDYTDATKKDFEKNKATIQQYLNDEHKNAQNYTELKEELELSKNNLVWWIGGVIVVMLIVNFFTVLSMNQTISKTVSSRVVNSIEEMRDTQAPKLTPTQNTNKVKKY